MFASLDQLRRTPSNASVGNGQLEVGAAFGDGGTPGPGMDGRRRADASRGGAESSIPRGPRFRWNLQTARAVLLQPPVLRLRPPRPCLRAEAWRREQDDPGWADSYDQDSPGRNCTVWLPTGRSAPARIPRWFCVKPSSDPKGARFAVFASIRVALSPRQPVAFRYGGRVRSGWPRSRGILLRPRAEINIRISDDWSTR